MGQHRNMGLLVACSLILMVTIDNINAEGSNCIEDNVAMPGNDIVETSPDNIKTKEDCCIACKNKEGCTFFTYRKGNEKCWLKNSDAGRKVDEEAVSGSVDCCKGFYINNDEIKLEKNKKLDDLPFIGKEFSVSFEFFLDSYPAADVPYVNVLHLTREDDGQKMGNRIPGLWIKPSKELHESFSISGNWNGAANHAIESGKWNKVEINQKLVDRKYMFEVLLNGESKRSLENTTPDKYENVKVFASNPWYPAADGKIRNLRIISS